MTDVPDWAKDDSASSVPDWAKEEAPKQDFSWSKAVTDVPSEIKKEAGAAWSNIAAIRHRSEQGPIEGLMTTGKAVLAPARLLASPFIGTARSMIGHGMANLEHLAGQYINPEVAAKDNPEAMYEAAKGDVDLAMSAMAPRGGLRGAPVTAPPIPATPPTNEVVAAANRVSQVVPETINVPRAFASDNIAVQRAGQLARNVPFVGDRIPQATGEMADQMGNAVKSIASHYGEGSGSNVANRIGRTLGEAAETETSAAQNAARASDEALLADWQRAQDSAMAQVAQHEQRSLTQARQATGDMSPQDMGQALVERLRAGEAEARARKDALYAQAGESDAAVRAESVRGVHDRVSSALDDAGRVVDPQLTPAANRMMDELRRFSNLEIPNRIGAPPPPAESIVSVGAQGMEQTRKRLGSLAQAANNDADRSAARLIMRHFDDWQAEAYDNALFSGSPEALQVARDARAANASWRQRFYNDRDDADRIINRIVTGEVTPQEVSNWIVGSSQVGGKGVSSRLLTRIAEVTNNDQDVLDAIRSGVANRLFGATEGVEGRTPEKTANAINEFFNGSGRDVANRLFTPQQRQAALNYAAVLRRGQEARQDIAAVAKNTKPSAMEVGPGPMRDLATSVLGRNGKSDEALFSAIDAYAKSGGRADVQTLADIVRSIPEKDKGDLAGAIIRKLGHSNQTNGFSPEKFATEWKKYTPQAKSILFGNSGPHRQALDDIATISQRYKEVGRRFGNPSGTAQNVAGLGVLASVFTHPYVAIPSLVGGAVFARLLSAPASAQKVAILGKASVALANGATPAKIAVLESAAKGVAAAANRLGSDVAASDIMRAIKGGSVPASADQEKPKSQGEINGQPNSGKDERSHKAHGGPVARATGGAANHNHNPTEAQKKAGNYAKTHKLFHGLNISVENLKGSKRSGVSKDGKNWSVRMPAHYGYIKGTVGADKDHVDCYLGPNERSDQVFVVDQMDDKTGRFDEHKCLLGFNSEREARETYLAGFSDGKNRIKHMRRMTIDEFKDWLRSGDTGKPIKAQDAGLRIAYKTKAGH